MHWQIDSEKLGTFALDVDRGLIPAKASQRVLVTFAPIEAANYHRRLTCWLATAPPPSTSSARATTTSADPRRCFSRTWRRTARGAAWGCAIWASRRS